MLKINVSFAAEFCKAVSWLPSAQGSGLRFSVPNITFSVRGGIPAAGPVLRPLRQRLVLTGFAAGDALIVFGISFFCEIFSCLGSRTFVRQEETTADHVLWVEGLCT